MNTVRKDNETVVEMTHEQLRKCALILVDQVELATDAWKHESLGPERIDELEDLQNLLCQAYRDALMDEVRRYKSYSREDRKEYADEAEHQDGYVYWLNFPDWKELANDIHVYLKSKGS